MPSRLTNNPLGMKPHPDDDWYEPKLMAWKYNTGQITDKEFTKWWNKNRSKYAYKGN